MVLIALGFIQLIYTLFHEFWLLAAKIHTLFAQRKNDRILEETKSKTKDGSNTELEAAPHTEPNTEQSDVPEWVKRIQKSNPSRARIFIHIRITCFVWCIVGAAGLVGLYAKPSPTTLPWVAFVFVPLLTICDYFFKARLESTLDSSTLMSAIQGLDWTIYSSCFLAASSMAALGVTYSPNSGTVAHGIAFGCFLFAILSREFFLVRIRNIVRRS